MIKVLGFLCLIFGSDIAECKSIRNGLNERWVPGVSTTKPKTILFVSHFFAGTEVNLMLDIADEMCDREGGKSKINDDHNGHMCHFIVMEPFMKRVRERGYSSVYGTPNMLEGEDYRSLTHAFQFTLSEWGWWTYIRKYVNTILPLAAKYYEPSLLAIQEFVQRTTPDAMVISKASESAADVAHQRGIPLVVLFSSPLGSMAHSYEDNLASAPDSNLWCSLHDHTKLWSRARKILGKALALGNPTSLLAAAHLLYVRYKHNLDMFVLPGGHWSKALILSTWSLGIDISRSLRPLTKVVGFITQPYQLPPTNALSPTDQAHLHYLNSKTDGVIFCAFGSLVILNEQWFTTIIHGIKLWVDSQRAAGKHNVGAVFAINHLSQQAMGGLEATSQILRQHINKHQYGDTIVVTDWIPQKMFLAHNNTKLFITHGGLASISESIHSLVPMLVIPFFFDQPNNSHRLQEAGVALKLHFREETVTSEKIYSKLNALTSQAEKYHNNLIRQYQISKLSGGATKAAQLIDELLLLEGNTQHLIPIHEKIPFPANCNADLYLLLLTLLSCAMYAAYQFFRYLFEEQLPDVTIRIQFPTTWNSLFSRTKRTTATTATSTTTTTSNTASTTASTTTMTNTQKKKQS